MEDRGLLVKIVGIIIEVLVITLAVLLLIVAGVWAWVDGMGWFTCALGGGVLLAGAFARVEASEPGTVLVPPHE